MLTSSPGGEEYTFYITSWIPGNNTPFDNQTLNVSLYNSGSSAQPASISIPIIPTNVGAGESGTGAAFTLTAVGGSGQLTLAGINMTSGGTGYSNGTLLNLYQGSTGLGPGQNGWIQVTSISSLGAILTFSLVNAWLGFITGAVSVNTSFSGSQTVLGFPFTNQGVAIGYTVNITSVNVAGQITGITGSGGTGAINGDTYLLNQGTNQSAIVSLTASGGAITSINFITLGGVPRTGLGYNTGAATLIPFGTVFQNVHTYTSGDTLGSVVAAIATTMSGDSAISALFNVAASPDGTAINLTAVESGIIGNTYNVIDASQCELPLVPPPFYAPYRQAQLLKGGLDFSPNGSAALTSFSNISSTTVGGTIYFANIGPMIIKYSGPDSFQVSTMYNGVGVLRKFAGSLVGLRKLPQLGTVYSNTDMMFLWSGAENLDEWSPVDSAGNITGAGFAQLADIEDYLTGLIISNNTAFIIRAQGLSYATALGSGTDPFQFAHIGLGAVGEGAQLPQLVCQYNETGAYIGNTDIYAISGQIQSIGSKIRASLFTTLNTTSQLLSSNMCAVNLVSDQIQLLGFDIDGSIYTYEPTDQTWMNFTWSYPPPPTLTEPYNTTQLCTLFGNIGGPNSESYGQTLFSLVVQTILSATPQTPAFYALQEGVANSQSTSNEAQVTFPQEELVVGRDVTVDSLYILLWGNVSEDVKVNFNISGQLFASYTLTPDEFNTMAGNPIPIQVFPLSGNFTVKAPQLQIQIPSLLDTGSGQVRFSKVVLFASVDPNQKPV